MGAISAFNRFIELKTHYKVSLSPSAENLRGRFIEYKLEVFGHSRRYDV
jgi:hypothetical protein